MFEVVAEVKPSFQIMLDIETLSTASDAAVLSIGLAKFDHSGVLDTIGVALKPSEINGHIDPNTVCWWMNQAQGAREYSFKGKSTAVAAAFLVKQFIEGTTEVWANDPSFDVVILKNWWNRISPSCGVFPIGHRIERSCRTIKALAPDCDISECYMVGMAHNPIDDAAMQARAVIKQRRHLFMGRASI